LPSPSVESSLPPLPESMPGSGAGAVEVLLAAGEGKAGAEGRPEARMTLAK
jgi:hypothetical protein